MSRIGGEVLQSQSSKELKHFSLLYSLSSSCAYISSHIQASSVKATFAPAAKTGRILTTPDGTSERLLLLSAFKEVV